MTNIFIFLILLLAAMIILGLIKPSIVIFWGSKTRKQILALYGSLLLLSFIFLVITVDDKGSKNNSEENSMLKKEPVAVTLNGSIIYDVSCTGSNKQGVELFKAFSPVTISIYYTEDKFRMIEKGGMAGNILSDFKNKQFYFLDSISKTAVKVACTDMENAMQEEKMRKSMPAHYRAILEETSETTDVCGLKCKKYKVMKSGFVKAYAKAVVWITNEIVLRQMRFNFETESRQILSPLPLQIGIDGGTILKMEVLENNVEVAYTARSVSKNKPDDKWFVLPADYQVKE